MIRRDYLLRMIEQCIQALTRSQRLVERREFESGRGEVDRGIQTLTRLDLRKINGMSDAELTAALLEGEPTQVLPQKCMLLVALLHRAGEIHAGEGKTKESRACYLKALNLQLDVLVREGPFDYPEFVPRVDALLAALNSSELPVQTKAMLMQHYERAGAYAKAEDALFNLLDSESANLTVADFGIQFYQRLLRQTDEALELGNLPRVEVEAGLAEWRGRFPE